MLYLLDGCCNAPPQSRDWTTPAGKGDAERITEGYDVITVMPDAGRGGMYTDWVRAGSNGRYFWERYLIGQLVPWVDASFRTRSHRGARAIAGLSMGGFGAMSLAARHPDLFVSASSFSGIVDSNVSPEFVTVLAAQDGAAPDTVFGDRQREQIRWRAHNPTDLAGNLSGLEINLFTGNGLSPGDLPPVDPIESLVQAETLSLSRTLRAAGIAHRLENRVGTHTWPYWNRALRLALPRIMRAFKPFQNPRSFNFRAAEARFTVYGYTVTVERSAHEFMSLHRVTKRSIDITGTGRATITTASRYRPGRWYSVRSITTNAANTKASVIKTARAKATKSGRLVIPVDICDSNTVDEFAFPVAGTRHTCTARIAIAIA